MFFVFTQAIIPIPELNQIIPEKIAKKNLYTNPVLGFLGYKSGFVYNLRFYGNYERGVKKDDGAREYSLDKTKGGDPIWAMVKILFPSTGGQLTTTSEAESNFGKQVVTPAQIAQLLNYTQSRRFS